jgi:hypothetical protein
MAVHISAVIRPRLAEIASASNLIALAVSTRRVTCSPRLGGTDCARAGDAAAMSPLDRILVAHGAQAGVPVLSGLAATPGAREAMVSRPAGNHLPNRLLAYFTSAPTADDLPGFGQLRAGGLSP